MKQTFGFGNPVQSFQRTGPLCRYVFFHIAEWIKELELDGKIDKPIRTILHTHKCAKGTRQRNYPLERVCGGRVSVGPMVLKRETKSGPFYRAQSQGTSDSPGSDLGRLR